MAGFSTFAARLLWLTGLAAVARRVIARHGVFVLELHGVASRPYPALRAGLRPDLTAADLRRLLGWLGARFRFVGPEEALAGADRGVLLTFDDGFANNHAVVLPLLEAHRAPAVFFVSTLHVAEPGRWLGWLAERVEARLGGRSSIAPEMADDLFDGMTPAQVEECARHPLGTVGSHTVSHLRLTTLGDRALAYELERSREQLAEMTGGPVSLLAYPFGDVDGRVAAAAARAGYRAAFAERPCPAAGAGFAVPRIGLYAAAPWYLGVKLSGLHQRPFHGLRSGLR